MLDLADFHSAPRSLRATADPITRVFCALPDSLCLPQGRLITWYRIAFNWVPLFFFRSQGTNPSPTVGHYRIRCSLIDDTRLEYYGPTGNWTVGSWPWKLQVGPWHRLQITWWSASDDQGNHALSVELEAWEAGAWVSKGILFDTADMHKLSITNRVGFTLRGTADWRIDDTSIWKPS